MTNENPDAAHSMLENDARAYRRARTGVADNRRDLRDELERFDGTFPDPWIPDVGDVLIGEVLRYDRGPTAYGTFPVVTVVDEEAGEERSVWLLHLVLRHEFARQRLRVGERVGIKRLPDGTSDATGHLYRRYVVRVHRPDAELLDPAADDLDFSEFG